MEVNTIADFEKLVREGRLLKKYNLSRIGVFGSFARGEKANDIDLFIDIDNYNVKDLIGLKRDLERITQRGIDIMIKEYANPIVLYRAQKEMKYVVQ